MNAIDLRRYWIYKFESTFSEPYKTKNYALDIILLKKLLDKYGEFVVLEATDEFFNNTLKRQIASINFFASDKVFRDKFDYIIKLRDIIKYKRFLPSFPSLVKEKANKLTREYQDYCNWDIISDKEKVRKSEIEKELKEMTSEFFSKRY